MPFSREKITGENTQSGRDCLLEYPDQKLWLPQRSSQEGVRDGAAPHSSSSTLVKRKKSHRHGHCRPGCQAWGSKHFSVIFYEGLHPVARNKLEKLDVRRIFDDGQIDVDGNQTGGKEKLFNGYTQDCEGVL